ncbi:MAG: DUF732 domain-containing protein [Mycobacterium sp.]
MFVHTTAVAAAVAAAGILAGLVTAPAAHADEQSYLQTLEGHGIGDSIFFHPKIAGYQICSALRGGMPPDVAASPQSFGFWLQGIGPLVVDTAQHELCPDMLK